MYILFIFLTNLVLTLQSAARLFGSSISSENLISVSGVGCGTNFLWLALFLFSKKTMIDLKFFITLFCMMFACLMIHIVLED